MLEGLADLCVGHALALIGAVHRRERAIEAVDRLRELLRGLFCRSRRGVGLGALALFALFGLTALTALATRLRLGLFGRRLRRLALTTRLGPAALLLGHRERLELLALRLGLSLRDLACVGVRLRRRFAPRLARLLRLLPLLAQLFARERRRRAIDGAHLGDLGGRGLALRTVARRALLALTRGRRDAERTLEPARCVFDRLRAGVRGRSARALELVLEAVDLGVDAPLRIFFERATQGLRLVGDLFRGARLGLFAEALGHRARQLRPRVCERHGRAQCEHTRGHPTRRARDRARRVGDRRDGREELGRFLHLQAVERLDARRRRVLRGRELHRAREAILGAEHAIEHARRAHRIEASTAVLHRAEHEPRHGTERGGRPERDLVQVEAEAHGRRGEEAEPEPRHHRVRDEPAVDATRDARDRERDGGRRRGVEGGAHVHRAHVERGQLERRRIVGLRVRCGERRLGGDLGLAALAPRGFLVAERVDVVVVVAHEGLPGWGRAVGRRPRSWDSPGRDLAGSRFRRMTPPKVPSLVPSWVIDLVSGPGPEHLVRRRYDARRMSADSRWTRGPRV